MLWRCFKDLPKGFYIDVGAQHPTSDSVTKVFYDRGWTGINIEPMTWAFEDLVSERLNDINLNLAIGDSNGFLNIWEFKDSGLSTANSNFSESHIKSGLSSSLVRVEMKTLANVCEQFVSSTIHFLKIDVEGFEKQVLTGADFLRFRPLVIVIEATEPNTPHENYLEWEHILLQNDYFHCYSDGLNRFYLAKEASYLLHHFKYPPNVFDDFTSNFLKQAQDHIEKLNQEIAEIQRELKPFEGHQIEALKEQIKPSANLTDYEINRILMTVSCKDSAAIPKVPNAGEIVEEEPYSIQLMHNGLRIVEGCYYGPWMTHIIKILKGHHEPQEELAFYEVLKQLKAQPSAWDKPTILELGSFWAYYSMWFLSALPEGRSFGIEPDPAYLEIGRNNFNLNSLQGVFINAQVAAENSLTSTFKCESDGQNILIPAFNFPGLVDSVGVREIDLVLVDIQGAEIPLLSCLEEVLSTSKIRFMLISTHDMEISGSPVTHQTALELLIQNGAHIISEHSVSESFSGDGFILASFFDIDKGLSVPISYNRSKHSLFGEWEPRLEAELEKKKFELFEAISAIEVKNGLITREMKDAFKLQNNEFNLKLQGELAMIEQEEQEIIYLKSALTSVLESKSWKLTKPLRTFAGQIRKQKKR